MKLSVPHQRRIRKEARVVRVLVRLLQSKAQPVCSAISKGWSISCRARGSAYHRDGKTLQRFRLFGQLPGRNKLKSPGSRLLVSPFPEIKFILSC
jgi:hypothetical protein